MDKIPAQTRQLSGCAYEPPPEERLLPFVRPWAGLGYAGELPTVCPGYSTSLPEVIDVARTHMHWTKGNFDVSDREPDDPLVAGLELLEHAFGETQVWKVTPRAKGGGAD